MYLNISINDSQLYNLTLPLVATATSMNNNDSINIYSPKISKVSDQSNHY